MSDDETTEDEDQDQGDEDQAAIEAELLDLEREVDQWDRSEAEEVEDLPPEIGDQDADPQGASALPASACCGAGCVACPWPEESARL